MTGQPQHDAAPLRPDPTDGTTPDVVEAVRNAIGNAIFDTVESDVLACALTTSELAIIAQAAIAAMQPVVTPEAKLKAELDRRIAIAERNPQPEPEPDIDAFLRQKAGDYSLPAEGSAVVLAVQERIAALEAEVAAMRVQGQNEGRRAAILWLRGRGAMKPRASLWQAAETLADQFERSLVAYQALKGPTDDR